MVVRLYHSTLGLSRQRRAALALLLGALMALALPPWHLVFLVVPGFAGFLWLLDAAQRTARPLRAAGVAGWLFGLGYYAVGVHWIVEPFWVDAARHAWLSPFALAGLAGGLALFAGATAVITAALARRFALTGISQALMFAVVWVVSEWVRSWLFTGFPWNLIGYVWTQTPAIMQAAAYIGIFGVSLLTVLAGAMPAALGSEGAGAPRRAWVAVAVFTVVLPALVAAAGALRLAGAPNYASDPAAMVPGVRLRVVQADIPQRLKWKPELRAGHLRRYIALSRQAAAQPPTLVIWPETAVPYFLANDANVRAAVALAVPPGGALITGAPRRGDDGQYWNSAHVIVGDGNIVATYDKAHLVPFGEYVPLRGILPIDMLVPGQGDFTAGTGPRTLAVPGAPPVSLLICYEAIFPGAVVDPNERPGWLLNLTNDAWFGTDAGPQQHFAIATTRTIEEGLPMVRAANTGISAVVDPFGRPLATLGLGVEGVIDSDLPRTLAAPPLYARWGNATVAALLFIIAIAAVLLRRAPAPGAAGRSDTS